MFEQLIEKHRKAFPGALIIRGNICSYKAAIYREGIGFWGIDSQRSFNCLVENSWAHWSGLSIFLPDFTELEVVCLR